MLNRAWPDNRLPACQEVAHLMLPERKTLIFDADDTLWENNVYFIQATEAFLDIMEQHRHARDSVREQLAEMERRIVLERGYGSEGFTLSLLNTARALLPHADARMLDRIEALGRGIIERAALDLRPGVETALDRLGQTNRLFLLTKGQDREQRRKLEMSRLATHFEDVAVVPEKNTATYRDLIRLWDLEPQVTWMIGNSPRSDINPALEAGLNAVFIPHPQTWELEIEEIVFTPSERLAIVASLGELIALFAPGT